MKERANLFPLAVLLVTVTCLFLQHRSVTAMERDIAELEALLAAAPVHATPTPTTRPEPIRWGQLTGQWPPPPGLWDRLRRQIAGMTKEEMIAALNEIAAFDMGRDGRRGMASMFLEPLAALDPELALTRFCGQFKTDRREAGSQQAKVFHQRAKQDLAATTTWFERQLAAGTFDPLGLDGSSPARNNVEAALVGVLLSVDPAAAKWLDASPPGPTKNVAVRSFAENVSAYEPQTAAQWALTLPPGADRDATLRTIHGNWKKLDPAASAAFAKEQGIGGN